MLRHSRALAALLLAFTTASASADVIISQAYGGGGNSGAPLTHDFVELFNAGTSATDIGGWSVQYTSSSGTGWNNKTDIPANTVLAAGQYFLIQQGGGSTGAPLPAADLLGNILMSGSNGKVILVNNSTAQTGACPATSAVVDRVGYGSANCPAPTGALSNSTAAIRKDNGCINTGVNSADFNVAAPNPRNSASALNPCSGPGVPAISMANISANEGDSGLTPFQFSVSLSEDAPVGGISFDFATRDGSASGGTDYQADNGQLTIAAGTRTASITINVIGNTTSQPNRNFHVDLSNVSGAAPLSLSATATIIDDDIAVARIHAIQGNGEVSPLAGQRVRSVGNIVTAIGPAGFFMQTPDSAVDSDPMTSEGIYVYTGSTPTLQIGDMVDLNGEVEEYYGLTELKAVSGLSITSSGHVLPAAINFDAQTPSQDPTSPSCGSTNFECFEGMRVSVADGIVARGNQYFSTDLFAQVFVSASGTRSIRTPGTLFPLLPGVDNPAAGAFNGNPHIFELDADVLGALPANTALSGGSRFSATGVMTYSFGDYELWATDFDLISDNVQPRAVNAGHGELRIGAFNMWRLCDTVANTTYTCGNGGEPNATKLALQLKRLSDYVGNVLRAPDVLGVIEVENIAVLQMLADRISLDHAITYTPHLQEGNDGGGIDVGYLVRSDRISGAVTTQFDKNETWLDPRDGQSHTLHDRPALLLEGSFAGQPFATVVIHPKARSCVDAPSGGSCTQDEVDRNRAKRFEQGRSIALRVQASQLAHPERPLLVIGDFNDYVFSDGFVHITGLLQGTYDDDANVIKLGTPNIVQPALWNAVTSLPDNEQYSFLFTEQFGEILGYTKPTPTSFDSGRDVPIMQVLDQALLNSAAKSWFIGFEYGRANLDAADQDKRLSDGAIGVSDHDGFVVRLASDRIFADGFGTN